MSGREGGYVPLEDYAAVGDGRTVALIASDGAIDWFPVPDLDSPPPFAALLDEASGGRWTLAPEGPADVARQYVDGTNVLATTYTTAHGSVRVTDSLNTGVAGRLPWAELARRVEGLSGEVAMRWEVAPGTCFGAAAPWVRTTGSGPVLDVDGVSLAVRGLAHGEPETTRDRIRGGFTTSAGSRHLVALVGTAQGPLHLPDPREVDRRVDRTVRNWQEWSREFSYDGPWAEVVHRSALALKLLWYSPSGAIAAAATTSLPEDPRGGKNWDYRYAWLRDMSYTTHVMLRFGLREEVHAAVGWLLDTIRRHDRDPQPFYRLRGELPPGRATPDLPGWRGIGPVVAGNEAAGQRQNGVMGDLFDVVRLYVEAGNVLDPRSGRLLAGIADRACDRWRRRDAGIWELPEERHYTSSKIACWRALDSAVRLAELGQLPGDSSRWAAERDAVREWVDEHCWSAGKGAYTWYAGTEQLDASVLIGAQMRFDTGPRMSSTIDAVRRELGRGPHLFRYTGVEEEEEGAFLACSFWGVAAMVLVGRRDEAREWMDELVPLVNEVGLLAEMVDPDDGAFLGNLPQALSHLALINAALAFTEQGDQE